MKIIINAVSAKMGGAVSYITNVLRHLGSERGDFEFIVFLPPETAAKLGGLGPNIRILPTEIGEAGELQRIWWEQVTLRAFLRKEGADVLFSTANFGMVRCPVRQLLLVRNALYFSKTYSETFLPKHSLRYRTAFALRRWLICQSARGATMVMTPTQALLNELREFVEVFPEKARVNPFGVAPSDASFPQGIERSTSESAQAAQQVVRLAYVSLYSEHKNLSTLLKALPLLNGNGAGKYRLTTTADPAWRGAAWTVTHQSDMELARRPYIAPWIEFSGPLSECEVQQLYRNADIFVFPSFCESFGHPMVEAMAHGLPIVAADTPVNREICAGAALYFRPLDPGDLAEKVKLVGSDQALTEKLRRSGRHRVADFRWEDHVERLLQAAGAAPTQKSSAA